MAIEWPGDLGYCGSITVCALQARLNAGTF